MTLLYSRHIWTNILISIMFVPLKSQGKYFFVKYVLLIQRSYSPLRHKYVSGIDSLLFSLREFCKFHLIGHKVPICHVRLGILRDLVGNYFHCSTAIFSVNFQFFSGFHICSFLSFHNFCQGLAVFTSFEHVYYSAYTQLKLIVLLPVAVVLKEGYSKTRQETPRDAKRRQEN